MTTHFNMPESVVDEVVQYALGLLPPTQADAVEDRLRAGQPEWVAAMRLVGPIADLLIRAGAEAHAVEPSLILRSHLINALGLAKDIPPFSQKSDPDPFCEDLAAMVLLRGSSIDWREIGVPGARMRSLYVDHDRRRATVLIQLDPGTEFPDHDHPDVEECLVLEGDLVLGGKVMGRFDYMRIPRGGQHGTPRTRAGCILLVTCGIAA